ncbi:MAG TPA: hypothetical protein VFT41_13550 [Gemmatimonadaceae bacterium]|nr:hypothetical protein [Gemmatimonadaceae bacterium]
MTVEPERDKVVFLHVPKTGGTGLQTYLFDRLRAIRRNYFLSFFGTDESSLYRDELATPRPEGNRCVIERAFELPELVREFKRSPHFQQAKLLLGHVTFAFGQLFPSYQFRYLTVLREPVERTISNIVQLSARCEDATIRFAGYRTRVPLYSDEYWEFVYGRLTAEYPIRGFLTHENCYLRNCMTRVLQGSWYLDPHEPPNLHLALVNAMRAQVSFFDDFNRGVQRSFDALGIPVDMSQNLAGSGAKEHVSTERRRLGRYYNAPQKVVDFVVEHNQVDIALYQHLKARIDGEPVA